MNHWLTSFNRKKHQRRINKYVRLINKNVYNDDLWRGRFVMRQVGTPRFYVYEDRSGADLENVQLVVIDLKTGKTCAWIDGGNSWCAFEGSKIWRFMNDAIVGHFDVWKADDDPRDHMNDPTYNFTNPKVRDYWRKEWK